METIVDPSPDKLDFFSETEIYSKRAVFWFGALITPFFGGVLLMISLRKLGLRKEGNVAFFTSLMMTLGVIFIPIWLNIEIRFLSVILSVVCSTFLSDFLYKKYIPNADEYPKKKVVLMSIVVTIILILFLLLAFWAQDQGI